MDYVTVYQLKVIIKKHHEKFKKESETRSYEVFMAISNALRKKGTPYQRLWSENEQETNANREDMKAFFEEVGVHVE